MIEDMLRPPINRAMRTLDRAFFKKTVSLSAARIFNNKDISVCQKELEKSKDLLQFEKAQRVLLDPDPELAKSGRKCLLLRPEIHHDDASTWSNTLHELADSQRIAVVPYSLNLDYDSWDYHDIITSILPENQQDEVPSGFSIVGHVAHLNLRSQYLPYKSLIASVLLDKNPTVKTVINKINDVGNAYRTFSYEILTGPDDLNVEVREEDCAFRFDYAKVYWNPRLHAEHKRLVSLFKEEEAVCDVMAGVGPFAVPAGRKRVFVWANDLNPDSYASLEDAVARNKVSSYVRPFNADGRRFIVDATRDLYHTKKQHTAEIFSKPARSSKTRPELLKTHMQPKFFSHYVMNLPASALSFLPAFVGLYTMADIPRTQNTPLPKVHVYCFSTKSDDNIEAGRKICVEISGLLGHEMKPGDGEAEGEVLMTDVRDVAPSKRMFCATFKLPGEVAWRKL